MKRKIAVPLPGGRFREIWKDLGKGGGTPRGSEHVYGIGGGRKNARPGQGRQA